MVMVYQLLNLMTLECSEALFYVLPAAENKAGTSKKISEKSAVHEVFSQRSLMSPP